MTISEQRRLTPIERAERNTDWAAVERRKQERAQREKAERIAQLRRVLFEGASRTTAHGLTSEATAAQALIRAQNSVYGAMVLDIVRQAIENKWHTVVEDGIRYFGEGPNAERLRDIYEYSLTTDQTSA